MELDGLAPKIEGRPGLELSVVPIFERKRRVRVSTFRGQYHRLNAIDHRVESRAEARALTRAHGASDNVTVDNEETAARKLEDILNLKPSGHMKLRLSNDLGLS